MLSIGPEMERTRILGEMLVAGGKGASPASFLVALHSGLGVVTWDGGD